MTRRIAVRVMLLWGLAVALLATSPAPALAQTPPLPQNCVGGLLGRAQALMCYPPAGAWNGDLVVFAHGYVAPAEGLPQIPWDQLQLPDGTSIPGMVMSLGFAFATTSYSDDGLAIVDGVQDLTNLVDAFAKGPWGSPDHVYVVGASEGGLVTTLAVEQSPLVFSGGVATCGPVGDFRKQINYWGDFRVLFDFYFPRLMPGTVTSVPAVSQEQWERVYAPGIAAALAAKPALLDKILRVSRAPFDPARLQTKVETALGILWYSAFATMDAQAKLGGQPFDNSKRLYTGSGNDLWLNLLVPRYHADLPALAAIEAHYQTTGRLEAPLVTLHTTGDPIVPYWHEPLYSLKALLGGSGLLHANLPVLRYGHCSFEPAEALVALGLLVLKVEGRELLSAERVLTTEKARQRYRSLARANGLRR
jgi:pimeloyl-ACP methyl ester carboxylesterase